MGELSPALVAYRLKLLEDGGTERLTVSILKRRRELVAEGMTEEQARQCMLDLGYKVGVE